MKIADIPTWEAFCAVARCASFSQAAGELQVPVAQVSKRIAKLEEQLAVRLFYRTTRVVTITDEGKALLPRITSILDDLRDAESLFEEDGDYRGSVKVTCVPFIAHRLLGPVLDEFMAKHPGIHIELELSESFVDLIKDGFDMAIRIETPKDSNLIYRKLAPNDLVFVASPEYLEARGKPTRPEHLADHDLLALSIHGRCKFRSGEFKLGDFHAAKKLTCENGVFLTDLALKGFGILVRSWLDVQEALQAGELVQVLKRHPLETFGHLHAVVPNKRYLAPRVRALLDFVVKQSAGW